MWLDLAMALLQSIEKAWIRSLSYAVGRRINAIARVVLYQQQQ
jgi:hypothetical protein